MGKTTRNCTTDLPTVSTSLTISPTSLVYFDNRTTRPRKKNYIIQIFSSHLLLFIKLKHQKQPKTMPGAIRPPWIDKKTFLKMPFNFCDRWCERCQFTTFCHISDSQISAFIAINSLLEVSEALYSLVHRKELRFIKSKLLRLNKISLQLVETVQQEFHVPII